MMDPLFFVSNKILCLVLSLAVIALQLLCHSQASLSFDAHRNASSASCPHNQKAALLQLKYGSFIQRGKYNSPSPLDSWNPDIDCCIWEGITCDEDTGHVIELDLSSKYDETSSRLEGQVNSSLFHIQSLQKLNLSLNNFYPNPIPSGFAQLTNLTHLDLFSCGFTGQIPLEILQLTKLVYLDLSSDFGIINYFNYYRIKFPGYKFLELKSPNLIALVRNLSSLEELFLSTVNISEPRGEWAQAIPSSLPNLRKLNLSYCGLSGPMNPSLFQLPFLSRLSLSENNLSETSFLGFVNVSSSLMSVELRNCSLYGKFPASVFLLPNLQKLDISHNLLLIVDLPQFPKKSALQCLYMDNVIFQEKLLNSISNLGVLKELSLSNCNISGLLPSSIANLTHLEILDLSFNNFKEKIPSSLFSLPSLNYIDLSWNQLNGQLDDIEQASPFLAHINLQWNKLQGPIPKFIFKLVELKRLSLWSNNFSGTIELLDMFQRLKNLFYLDLSDNNLFVMDNKANSSLISSSQIKFLRLCSCNLSEFPNIIRNQNQLSLLDLSNNKIRGEIPSWVWKVGNGNLKFLNLSHNFLESFEQPHPDLSFCGLVIVDLHSNQLQGSIPIMPSGATFQDYSKNNFSSIPHAINLTFTIALFLSVNNFHGEIPIVVCKASRLRFLDLSNNNFIGNIPKCLGGISDSLRVLNLAKNSFSGMLPQSFNKDCSLRTLNVQKNKLEGPLPRSLANCKILEVLDFGNNQINDTFPFWLENLLHLRILSLRSNKFHGPITYFPLGNQLFPLLQIFDISYNFFNGSFPSKLFLNWKPMMQDLFHLRIDDHIVKDDLLLNGMYYQDSVTLVMKGLDIEVVKILTTFTAIDISNNKLEGKIPESIGNLSSLRLLNFSRNNFSGSIPTSLENLTILESLDLSQNKLSGEIPRQLLELTFLEVLNLSQNFLVGSIPQGKQFLTFSNSSFLGNPGLCGPPLSRTCEDAEAPSPSNFDSFGLGRIGEIDWRMMWIGFGVGFGVGLGVLFWTLVLWKRGGRMYMHLIDAIVHKLFHFSV